MRYCLSRQDLDSIVASSWPHLPALGTPSERRLIVGDHDRSEGIVDLALLKVVARAHRWFDELSTGKANSLAQIAAREGLSVRYVGRLIRLAFLAPNIVESIIQGRQPTTLTAEGLTRHIAIPLEWRSQETALDIR
jgi:hypothetical protein